MYTIDNLPKRPLTILSYTAKAMRASGYSEKQIDKFMNDADSKDFTHLQFMCKQKCTECNQRESTGM